MLRLVVIGGQDLRWQEIGRRLRGVELETVHDATPGLDSLQRFDAVALLDASPIDDVAIQNCLRAGKHVLLSADYRVSKELLQSAGEAARPASVHLAVANPDRYLPSRQLIRQQLDAGKLGEPGLIRLHHWEPARANPHGAPGALAKPLRDLDLVLWLMGKPPNLVYAVERAGIHLHLGFPGGRMALMDHTDRLPSDSAYCSLSIIGSAGAAYADDHQNLQLVYRQGAHAVIGTDESALAWSALLQDFIEAVTAGRRDDRDVTAWHNVLAVSDSVQLSLRTGEAVVPEGLR